MLIGKSRQCRKSESSEPGCLQLDMVVSRLVEYLQDCLSNEQAFLDRLIPDLSERSMAISTILTTILKVCERSISSIVARCSSLKTLSTCSKLLAENGNNPHLLLVVECLARAITKQSSFVIDNQAVSIRKSFKPSRVESEQQVNTITKRLAELLQECDCSSLFTTWLEMIDKLITKGPKHIVFAMKNIDYMCQVYQSEELQPRLDELAPRFAEYELEKMDGKMLMALNTTIASSAVANMLISAFNSDFRLWLSQFHVSCLQNLCEHERLKKICHQAFSDLLLSIYTGIQTLISFLPEDEVDTLVPISLVNEEIKTQLM